MSNRKNAYKIVKQQRNGVFVLLNKYGRKFKEDPDRLESAGYKQVKSKPRAFS